MSLLASVDWTSVSGRLQALGYTFGIRSSNPELGAWLTDGYRSLEQPGDVERWFSVVDYHGLAEERFVVYLDDDVIASATGVDGAVQSLYGAINGRTTAASVESWMLVHGAAAAREGKAVLLPGPSGAGKTSLVAALVADGYDYITDELVALDRETLHITPHPKPLWVKSGSHALVKGLARGTWKPPRWAGEHWLVPPEALRPRAVAQDTPAPALILLPEWREGATTEVLPIRPVEAVKNLAASVWNMIHLDDAGLPLVRRLVETVPCQRLVFGDARAAVPVIVDALKSMAAA